MGKSSSSEKIILCPSARPETSQSQVFGIVGGSIEQPQITYLQEPLPVTDELMALASPVTPTEVFRFAGTCATIQCKHFDGKDCRLAQRITTQLPAVIEHLPACAISRDCRWFQQEGEIACFRCPQIVTDDFSATELNQQVGLPKAVS